ncbi:putative carboxylesterase [Helianthus debilis subsp. tardiflorus]
MRLHHAIDVEESEGSKKTKRPICITFGCPLVGDKAFASAIDERPQWKYSFLNVVANKDPVATFFSSDPYKPFGTFLFCTESGGYTAFEDQDSILLVIDAMKSPPNEGNLQDYDYTNILISIRRKVLYRGVSELGESNLNLLRAGITLQFKEVGVLNDISNDQIGKMETKLNKRKKNPYEPTTALNEVKISLTYMEWYMKSSKSKGCYYERYKNAKAIDEIEKQQLMPKHQRILNKYWKKTVEEKDRMPQKKVQSCLRVGSMLGPTTEE